MSQELTVRQEAALRRAAEVLGLLWHVWESNNRGLNLFGDRACKHCGVREDAGHGIGAVCASAPLPDIDFVTETLAAQREVIWKKLKWIEDHLLDLKVKA